MTERNGMTERDLLAIMAAILVAGRSANSNDKTWKITSVQEAKRILAIVEQESSPK
jgi:cell division protein ZapA (FtsZ GTPase activity inhibitor)